MSKLIAKEINEVTFFGNSRIKAIAKEVYDNLVYDVQVIVQDEVNDEIKQDEIGGRVFQEVENMLNSQKWKTFKGLNRR